MNKATADKILDINIVSASRSLYSGRADFVVATTVVGEVGIKPGHTQLLAQLRPGNARIYHDGKQELFYLSGGIIEVQPDMVTILADEGLRAEEIDEEAALRAKQNAEKILHGQKGELDYAKVRAELAEALARLQVIRRLHKTGTK